MTPAFFEASIIELCKTTNREVLHTKGLALIQDALGDNSPMYIPAIDKWLERVKQLGKPVVPVPFKGAGQSGEGKSL